MLQNFDKFYIKNGILFRETRNGESTSMKHKILLPYSCMKTVLKYLHTDMGHTGPEKTTCIIQDRFYWFEITKDIENFIKSCSRCFLRKAQSEKKYLVSIKTLQPLDLLCIDFLTLESYRGGFQKHSRSH
jgi:hypothetical protein